MSDDNGQSVSRFQAFTPEVIHRSQLMGAPYNPRQITEDAKTRLKGVLAKVGLVQPIVWNRRSGNIVGGHQRIKAMDALEGSTNYRLTVAVVDVDEVREKELNVALNAPQVCGDFDFGKLQEVLDTEGFELEAAGFDMADVMKLFGEAPSQGDAADGHKEMIEEMTAVKEAYNALDEAHRAVNDKQFFNVIVYRSRADREALAEELGYPDERYLDGRTLTNLVRGLKARIKELEATPTGSERDTAGVR